MKRVELLKIDVDKYVNDKAQIVSAEVVKLKFGTVIKVLTNPLELKGDDKLPEGRHLTGSILLGLVDSDEGLAIGIDGKSEKWLIAHGVDVTKDIPDDLKIGDQCKALLGKDVVVQKNTGGFLEIA